MSYVSMCGGPPGNHTKMIEVSSSLGASAASARNRSSSANVMPPKPSVPTRRNSRRDTGPGQIESFCVMRHLRLSASDRLYYCIMEYRKSWVGTQAVPQRFQCQLWDFRAGPLKTRRLSTGEGETSTFS